MAGISLRASLAAKVNMQSPQTDSAISDRRLGATYIDPAVQSGQPDWMERLGPAYKLELSTDGKDSTDPEVRRMKQTGQIECQTCRERKYQDGSDDPGVSFKTAGHISPEASAAVVSSHEQEHVTNERAKAQSEGRKVVSQSVSLYTSVCPECGRSYVSGGKTCTTTAADTGKEHKSSLGNKVDLLI